jgi:hypothetical protein
MFYVYIITPSGKSKKVVKVGVTVNPKMAFQMLRKSNKKFREWLDNQSGLPDMNLIKCKSKNEAEDLKKRLIEKYKDTIIGGRSSKYDDMFKFSKVEDWL